MSELNIFKKGYHNWKHPIYNVRQFFRNCKYAWQRATKGYSDWDTWDLWTYYGRLIPTSLRQFAEETIGYPCNDSYENWVNKINTIADNIEASTKHEDEYWERAAESPLAETIAVSNDELTSREEAKKYFEESEKTRNITINAYKDLGEIVHDLWW